MENTELEIITPEELRQEFVILDELAAEGKAPHTWADSVQQALQNGSLRGMGYTACAYGQICDHNDVDACHLAEEVTEVYRKRHPYKRDHICTPLERICFTATFERDDDAAVQARQTLRDALEAHILARDASELR